MLMPVVQKASGCLAQHICSVGPDYMLEAALDKQGKPCLHNFMWSEHDGTLSHRRELQMAITNWFFTTSCGICLVLLWACLEWIWLPASGCQQKYKCSAADNRLVSPFKADTNSQTLHQCSKQLCSTNKQKETCRLHLCMCIKYLSEVYLK